MVTIIHALQNIILLRTEPQFRTVLEPTTGASLSDKTRKFPRHYKNVLMLYYVLAQLSMYLGYHVAARPLSYAEAFWHFWYFFVGQTDT